MLVLASSSPRRREILTAAGFDFIVRAPEIPEVRRAPESPIDYVRRLAYEKARAVPMNPGETILAADTTVVIGEELLEKPRDAWDATRMLLLLSDATHDVITGICLLHGERTMVDATVTRVQFAKLSDAEIAEYIASGEPMGKAGAYAIQGLASKFVERVEGCYFNVVGLPVALVYRNLKAIGAIP
ncbi:MAG TPA: Maf family protein [Patescibacteria group bacterium]|nr:Maf family protein [Patescibacteria group bacterium]